MWVEITLLSLVKVMVIRWSARRKFLTGVPFIMKIEIAPVSAMALLQRLLEHWRIPSVAMVWSDLMR